MNELELIDKQALIEHLNITMYRDVIEEIKNFESVTPVIARQMDGLVLLIPTCKVLEASKRQGEWIKGREISRTMIGDKVEHIEYKDYTCSNWMIMRIEKTIQRI